MASKKHPTRRHTVAKNVIQELIVTRERMNRAGVEFLKLDIETALTFLTIARQSQDGTRQKRNVQSAFTAYQTVLRLADRLMLNDEDSRVVTAGLQQLRSELITFGVAL